MEENTRAPKVLVAAARLVRAPTSGRAVLLTILAVSCLAAAGSADATTMTVCTSGCPYTSIADAIAAAHSGKKITVGPGTYSGGLVIDKNVRLVGSGLDQTVIQGGGMVVTVTSGVSVSIRGVTITGGMPDYSLPDPTPSGGILNAGTLTVRDSVIADNQAVASGGGIYNTGALTLVGTLVRHNSFGGSYNGGGGVYNDHGSVVLDHSAVTENSAYLGGGIDNNGGSVKLTRTAVSGNAAAGGGGIANEGAGILVIRHSTLSDNTVNADVGRAGAGGAIDNAGTATISDTAISGNRAYLGGGISNGGTLTIAKSSIDGNTGNYSPGGPDGSGGGIYNFGTLTLRGTVVSNNTLLPDGGGDGGGIFNTTPGSVVVHDGAVFGNSPDDCVGC